MMFTTIPRKAWAGEALNPVRQLPRQTHDHLEVHHSVTASPVGNEALKLVSNIYTWHTKTVHKWSDIFYHYLITGDGEVIEGRALTSLSQGTAVTVCCLGNYAENEVPAVVKAAILDLNDYLQFNKEIDWHAQRAKGTKYASACPGKYMIDWLLSYQDEVDTVNAMSRENAEWNVDWAYTKILGRTPDIAGRTYWTTRLVDGAVKATEMRWEFQAVRNAAQDDELKAMREVLQGNAVLSTLDDRYNRFIEDLIVLARGA
jgi:hypothetical protein